MYNPFVMLFVLAIPVACISWTVTHEEVFKEIREFCVKNSQEQKTLVARKFFYLFTCEYCFSHYIAIFMLMITGYKLLFDGWQGYLVAGFSLVWIANIYMGLYGLIRLDIKIVKTEVKVKEKQLEKQED